MLAVSRLISNYVNLNTLQILVTYTNVRSLKDNDKLSSAFYKVKEL